MMHSNQKERHLDKRMLGRSILFVFLALALAFCVPASTLQVTKAAPTGTVYYVDFVHGSDTNVGNTRVLPWKTIQKAADSMAPGDTATVLAAAPDERVHVTKSGTTNAPIAFQAEGTVVMKGFTVTADYITLKGFEITNTDDDNQDGWGIYVEGGNCLIEGNYVRYATRGGITIWARPGNETATNHCTVRNNRLYRNSQVGIDVYGRDNLVEGNDIWGTIQYHPKWVNPPSWVDADGIHFFGSGHIIRGNYIHDIKYDISENVDPHIDCFQTFSNSDHELAQNIIIEKNICKNVQAQATGEIGKGFMLEGANHLLIRNNVIEAFNNININGDNYITIVNNVMTSSLSLNMGFDTTGVSLSSAPNTIVKNNIFYNLPNHIIYIHDNASKQGLDVGYNCVYRNDGVKLWDTPYPHDLWGINPLFANPGADDFRLMPVSPAIDRGITRTDVIDDYSGNPRPQGRGYDIGIFEHAPVAIYSVWLPVVISK
jgi:parallel beta-helix repeat protein